MGIMLLKGWYWLEYDAIALAVLVIGLGAVALFRDQCRMAGLDGCSAHGLRKAAARRLAEAGCSAHEIASITGHASLREIARYTEAADRRKLAVSAMAKIKIRTSSG